MDWLVMVVIMIMAMVGVGAAQESCVQPLDSLLDCLAYAQGKASSPTASCCSNVKRVFESQKKCLCELIAASFHGDSMGLPPFNQSLALDLPSACDVPADPSECPGLLGIPLSSSEAKEFDNARNATSTSKTSQIISSTPSSTALSMITSSTPHDNGCQYHSPSLSLLFLASFLLLVTY